MHFVFFLIAYIYESEISKTIRKACSYFFFVICLLSIIPRKIMIKTGGFVYGQIF